MSNSDQNKLKTGKLTTGFEPPPYDSPQRSLPGTFTKTLVSSTFMFSHFHVHNVYGALDFITFKSLVKYSY